MNQLTAITEPQTAIFLGVNPTDGGNIMQPLASHALTFAAPRCGKGACQIIPTLRHYWQGNVICVDPKAEALRYSYEHREAMGQKVVCIDPVPKNPDTGEYSSPERFRQSFNPLDLVRSGGAGTRDLMMLADGLVVVTPGSRDPFFDESARAVVAGSLAFLKEFAPPEKQTLRELLNLLDDMSDPDTRDALFQQMKHCQKYGGMARRAASLIKREGGKSDSILSTVIKDLTWLTDDDMLDCLSESSFDLNELRTEQLSLFLVLPANALDFHAPFLRLFTRCALAVMKNGDVADGISSNRPCLFLLDEFAKLGKIDTILEDCAFMPGYGVHLWPIAHGIGQLRGLYGPEGAHTLQGASTVITAFGLQNDDATAELVSRKCGNITTAEIEGDLQLLARRLEHHERVRSAEPGKLFDPYSQAKTERLGGTWRFHDVPMVSDHTTIAQVNALRSTIGKPRYPPDAVKQLTARSEQTKVANRMFIFANGIFLILIPSPYFAPAVVEPQPVAAPQLEEWQQAPFVKGPGWWIIEQDTLDFLATCLGIVIATFLMLGLYKLVEPFL